MKRLFGMLGLVVALALMGTHEVKAETPHDTVAMVDVGSHGPAVEHETIAPVATVDVVAVNVQDIGEGRVASMVAPVISVEADRADGHRLPGRDGSPVQMTYGSDAEHQRPGQRSTMLVLQSTNSESSIDSVHQRIRGVAWRGSVARIAKQSDRHI